MMNTVLIAGRITHEPEIKFFAREGGGGSVATFSIANHADYYADDTFYFNIAAFGKLAQITEQNLHRGMMVYVKGYLRQKSYTRGDGKRANDISIVAERLYFTPERPVRESEQTTPKTHDSVRESEQVERVDESDMFIQTEIDDGDVPF